MIEHCVSSYQKRQKELTYRVYMTDSVKVLIEAQYGGVELPRYIDQIEPKKQEEPEETAEMVIARITEDLKNMGK